MAAPAAFRLRSLLPCLAIAAASIAVYFNSLSVPFLLDDATTITGNPSIRQLSSPGQVLFPPPEIYSAGRPLLNLSFAFNYAFGGNTVTGYHLVNALIHTLAALVLFGLARRTLILPRTPARLREAAAPLALAIALLWLVHPVQTISVTYVSQRAESLMGLFYLLTLYAFVRGAAYQTAGDAPTPSHVPWLAAAVAACACGMATKEVMATAPVLALLYDRQFVSGTFRAAWQRHRRFYLALAATWLVLLALVVSSNLAQRGVGHGLGRLDYLRIESRALLHYLRVSLWPDPLIFDFGPQLAIPAGLELAWRFIALVLLLAGSLVAFWRSRAIGLAGLAFFLLLAPTSSLVPVGGQPIAENRVYLPLAAVIATLVIGLYLLLGRRGGVVFALGVLLPLSWAAHERNRVFQSEISVWADSVQKQPYNIRAWSYLAIAQFNGGQRDAAIATLFSALKNVPNDPELHNNLGAFLYLTGRAPEAIEHLRQSIRLNPASPSTYGALGRALLAANDPAGATDAFDHLTRLEPQNAEARNLLGIALSRLGRAAEAAAQFETALQLQPDYSDARTNLATVRGERP